MRKLKIAGFALIAGAFAMYWAYPKVAVWMAPAMTPEPSTDPVIVAIQDRFMETLHAGRYDDIPTQLAALRSAYFKNPQDPRTLLYLSHAHFWKGSERARLPDISEVVPDNLELAHNLFRDAYQLNQDDKRILAWKAAAIAELGIIINDQKRLRQGYFDLKDAINQHPQFGYFTMGYMLSNLPARHPLIKEGVDAAWKVLDVCNGSPLDRNNPTLEGTGYFERETHTGPRRVCYSGEIAPHGLEGVIFNLGEMLVKSGDPELGKKAYKMTRSVPSYATWPYKTFLEERIAQADQRAELFRTRKPKEQPESLGQSKFVCVVCHQR